jgi:D-alanyl-D-alanine carboxypeptidase
MSVTASAAPPLPRQAYLRQLKRLASDGLSGAVAVVVTPAGTWKAAVGWADFDAKRRADPENRFAIESTTKTIVATVVLQLVGERRLALHDTVQHWLPGLFPRRPRITIDQLLTHTSGLVRNFSISAPPWYRARQIAAASLMFKPGTSVQYSNSDFVILGLIVEKVTGRSLDRVVTNRIIRRLGLKSTSYGTLRAERMTPWLGVPEFFGRPVSGDGGVISTVDDLATFFRALLGGKLLRAQQLAELKRTVASDDPDFRFGHGIFRMRLPCGDAWGHGGLYSYVVETAVAGDGSKAVIIAENNPRLPADDVAERMYCA